METATAKLVSEENKKRLEYPTQLRYSSSIWVWGAIWCGGVARPVQDTFKKYLDTDTFPKKYLDTDIFRKSI